MSALQSALDFPLSGYRKLWAFPPAYSQAPPEHNRQSSSYKSEFTLGSDLLVVLAAFFCALICAPGLNALLKWALRCSRRRVSNSSDYEVDISLGNAGLKEEAMTALPVIICTATSNPPAMSNLLDRVYGWRKVEIDSPVRSWFPHRMHRSMALLAFFVSCL